MTSQIRSCVKYLIRTYNIILLLLHSNFARKSSFIGRSLLILFILSIHLLLFFILFLFFFKFLSMIYLRFGRGLSFAPPCIYRLCITRSSRFNQWAQLAKSYPSTRTESHARHAAWKRDRRGNNHINFFAKKSKDDADIKFVFFLVKSYIPSAQRPNRTTTILTAVGSCLPNACWKFCLL